MSQIRNGTFWHPTWGGSITLFRIIKFEDCVLEGWKFYSACTNRKGARIRQAGAKRYDACPILGEETTLHAFHFWEIHSLN